MNRYVVIILFGLFMAGMLISMAVSFSMGISAAASFLVLDFDLVAMIRRMNSAFRNFPQLAVPFYILAGHIMSRCGVSKRIFDFARALIGHVTGGLANVNIIASMIFAGMSGSALADIGGLGTIEMQEMKRAGYDVGFSSSVTLASATIGPIIPPSIHFVIYAVLAEVSVGRLFVAGFIPGLLIGLLLMITVFILIKTGYAVCPTDEKKSFKEIVEQFKKAFLSILAPLIILGGIATGFTTPTEAGIIAIIYSFCLTLIYREITFRELKEAIEEAMLSFSTIMVIVSFAMSIGWVFTYTRAPHNVAALILGLTDNPILVLLIIILCLIALGSVLDPLPVLLITTPIFLPLVQSVGIDLIQFGVIMSFTPLIGLQTPPAAIGLYLMTKIADISFEDTFKAFLPWFIPLILAAILFSVIPKLSLWLPSLIFD